MNSYYGLATAPVGNPAETVKPPDTAPDVLFGDCGALDAESLFRQMLPDEIKFFDLPLMDRLHRRQYHMVRLRGFFRLAKLVRDYRPQLLRSESYQNARGRTCIERLLFSLGGEVYMVRDTYEFYFMPVSTFDSLDSPRFVRFWLEEAEGGKRRIAVVEDAESLLLPRTEGSQSSVSSLLNATDGLLGDHLRLQILCTTNAPVRKLDAALTRPGRLVGVREFGRLPSAQAQRLAQAKGLKLPDQPDYSLGEIYCGAVSGPVLNADRQIGFAQ